MPTRVAVAERVAVERGVDDRQDVVDVDGAPTRAGHGRVVRALDRLAPAGVPAAAAAWVAEHDDEAGRRLHLELVVEVLAVLGVRATVDVEQDRVPLRLVEVGGSHDPGVDLVGPVGGGGGEVLPLQEFAGELVADVRAPLVADVQLARDGRTVVRAVAIVPPAASNDVTDTGPSVSGSGAAEPSAGRR